VRGRDSNNLTIYGIPRKTRHALRVAAERLGKRSTSALIREYVESVVAQDGAAKGDKHHEKEAS